MWAKWQVVLKVLSVHNLFDTSNSRPFKGLSFSAKFQDVYQIKVPRNVTVLIVDSLCKMQWSNKHSKITYVVFYLNKSRGRITNPQKSL